MNQFYPILHEQHTVPAALDVLRGVDPPLGEHDELPRAAEWFVGCLMLDASSETAIDTTRTGAWCRSASRRRT